MQLSVEISLSPLKDEYIPAIKGFIDGDLSSDYISPKNS